MPRKYVKGTRPSPSGLPCSNCGLQESSSWRGKGSRLCARRACKSVALAESGVCKSCDGAVAKAAAQQLVCSAASFITTPAQSISYLPAAQADLLASSITSLPLALPLARSWPFAPPVAESADAAAREPCVTPRDASPAAAVAALPAHCSAARCEPHALAQQQHHRRPPLAAIGGNAPRALLVPSKLHAKARAREDPLPRSDAHPSHDRVAKVARKKVRFADAAPLPDYALAATRGDG